MLVPRYVSSRAVSSHADRDATGAPSLLKAVTPQIVAIASDARHFRPMCPATRPVRHHELFKVYRRVRVGADPCCRVRILLLMSPRGCMLGNGGLRSASG